MRSTASGKNTLRSNISSNQNFNTSINRIANYGTNHSISNEVKFVASQELVSFPQIDQYWDASFRNRRTGAYEGDYKAGKKWGTGSFWYENGDFYHGNWENDRPQGEGLFYFADKDNQQDALVYSGNFDHGTFHGFGKLFRFYSKTEASWIYQGSWRYGKREGQGKQFYNSSENHYYSGSWLQDERNGLGTLVFPEGEYEGTWENGKMHGEGKLSMRSGSIKIIYTGIWNLDELHSGKIQYIITTTGLEIGNYSGEINDYLRHGRGTYREGDYLYEGIFQNDEPVGRGTFTGKNVQQQWTLVGDFGTLTDLEANIAYSNKEKYQGFAEIRGNQVYRTTGKYSYKNGEKVEGTFEDNELGELRGDFVFER